MLNGYTYDLAISYASEQFEYVREFADAMIDRGYDVFLDRYETVRLLSTFLHEELYSIFRNESRHVILFISDEYSTKPHALWEAKITIARSIFYPGCFTVARFSNAQVPCIDESYLYLDTEKFTAMELAELMSKKLT